MERIERDLQSAWANGMVEMHLASGPAIGPDDGADAPLEPSPATV